MVPGVEGEAELRTLYPELDVIGVDGFPHKFPILLLDVVPVLGELKVVIYIGCEEHLLIEIAGM